MDIKDGLFETISAITKGHAEAFSAGAETQQSIIEAQRQAIAELQEIVTRENKGKEKIAELREIIRELQEENLRLRKGEKKNGKY